MITRHRYAVHVLAVTAVLAIIAVARSASSGGLSGCGLDLSITRDTAIAKVQQ